MLGSAAPAACAAGIRARSESGACAAARGRRALQAVTRSSLQKTKGVDSSDPFDLRHFRGRGSWKIGFRTNRDEPTEINDSKGLRGEAAGFFPLPGGLLPSYFVSYFVAAGSPNACQRSAAAGGTGPRLRSIRSTGCA